MIDIECYFDDSSDPKREKYYACGGLVGNLDQWTAFEIYWAHETRDLKLPFRSTDCECGHGQFGRWPKPKRDELMARLVNVIWSVQLVGFGYVVPIPTFKKTFPTLNADDAFALVATHAIVNAAMISHRGGFDASLWFEDGKQKGKTLAAYDSVKGLAWKPSGRLKGLHFGDKGLRPLQSADLLAREAFKHMMNLGLRGMRRPVQTMRHEIIFMLWTEAALEHLAHNGGPANLDFLVHRDEKKDAKLKHFYWKRPKA